MLWHRWSLAGVMMVVLAIAAPSVVRADTEQAALKSVGALSVAFFYQTQVNIGILADATAKEVYEQDTANQLLQLSLNFIEMFEKQMNELLEEKLDDSDVDTLETFKEVNDQLKKEAVALQAFWKRGRDADRMKYLEARAQVQKMLDNFGD